MRYIDTVPKWNWINVVCNVKQTLRDRRTCNVKDEMINMEYETLQVQTLTNANEPANTIFCYKHA